MKTSAQSRVPLEPKLTASGVENARPFTPMRALALLSTLQSGVLVLPTTDGRELRLRHIMEPTAGQKSLLRQLGLTLPVRLESPEPIRRELGIDQM